MSNKLNIVVKLLLQKKIGYSDLISFNFKFVSK